MALFVGTRETIYTYDGNSNVVTKRYEGALVELDYDGHDRIGKITDPVATETNIAHEPDGVRSVAVTNGGLITESSVAERDAVLRPKEVQQDQLPKVTYEYMQLRTIETVHNQDPLAAGGAQTEGNTREWNFNSSGRTTALVQSDIGSTTFALDTAGRRTSATMQPVSVAGQNVEDFVRKIGYDDLGFVTRLIDSLDVVSTEIDRRADGVVTKSTQDPNGEAVESTTPVSNLGEPLGRETGSGVTTHIQLDELRRPERVGPPSKQRVFVYDNSGYLERIQFPNGTEQVTHRDTNGLATSIDLPGTGQGSITALSYDDARRVTARTITYDGCQSTSSPVCTYTDTEGFSYDPLGRLLDANFNGDSIRHAHNDQRREVVRTLTVDLGGANATNFVMETELDRTNNRDIYHHYPFGPAVHETRSKEGRLVDLTADSAAVVASIEYSGRASAAGLYTFGNGLITREDTFDQRQRLERRVYSVGGVPVSDVHYTYDGADREIAREDKVRGVANFYQYDASSRLTYADLRARNLSGNSAWSVQSSALPGNWTAGDYQRTYDFTGTGNDEYVRTSTTLVHASPTFPTPATGHDFGLPDAIGHVPDIDGVAREVDPMGNTIRTPGEHGILDLEYDGRRRLRKVTRDDGAIITYAYRSDGPLYRRTVTCDAPSSNPLVPPDFCEVSDTIYAYDGLLLRGEYDATQTSPVARALYYYADEGDIPIAADLWDDALQGLTRVYYVTDRQGSVLGLLNESGQWVERVWYDPWGRPVIESVEQAAPVISEILPAGPDSIYVVFSQPVVPVGSLVAAFAITAVNGGAAVNLVDATQVALAGKVPGTVVQVTAAAGGLVTNQEYDLEVAQGGLLNTWGYSGGGVSEIFEHSVARSYSGTVAPVYLERSRLGNGLLFHSHLYDYDADLVLARARVLDPRTGMFLQQDPEGYVDSANLYVGFRWDPVNLRDPTGREIDVTGLLDRDLARLLDSLESVSGVRFSAPCLESGPYSVREGFGSDRCARRILQVDYEKPPGDYSIRARDRLLAFVSDPDVVYVESAKSDLLGSNPIVLGAAHPVLSTVYVDLEDMQHLTASESVLQSFSPAFIVLHELYHSYFMPEVRVADGDPLPDERERKAGEIEDSLNKMRVELGLPTRDHYKMIPRKGFTRDDCFMSFSRTWTPNDDVDTREWLHAKCSEIGLPLRDGRFLRTEENGN